jgi:hypothetical protein
MTIENAIQDIALFASRGSLLAPRSSLLAIRDWDEGFRMRD